MNQPAATRSRHRLQGYIARMNALEAAASRLARAGDADDCGHVPAGHHKAGEFDHKNWCASLRGRPRGEHPASRGRPAPSSSGQPRAGAKVPQPAPKGPKPAASPAPPPPNPKPSANRKAIASEVMDMVRDALESRESQASSRDSGRDVELERAMNDDFGRAMDAMDDEFGEDESGLPSTPPPPEPIGKSTSPGGLKYINAHSDVDNVARNLFGRDISPEEMGSLTGIAAAAGHVPGSQVEVRTSKNWDTGGDNISLSYDVPGKLSITRTIKRDKNGDLHIHNDLTKIDDDLKGKGIGIDVFSSQVEQAIKGKISYIDNYSAGSYNQFQEQGEDKWMGYYVWPRFGYQRTVQLEDIDMYNYREDENKLSSLANILGRTTDDIRENRSFEISDLMKTPEGQKWWKINGHGGNGKFDLAEGSISRRVLSEYRKEKGIDKPDKPNRFRRGATSPRLPISDDIYGYPDYYPRAIRQIARDAIKDEIARLAKAPPPLPLGHRIGAVAGKVFNVPKKIAQSFIHGLENSGSIGHELRSGPPPLPGQAKPPPLPRAGGPPPLSTDRSVKAGSSSDCGHRVEDGRFDTGNTCASGNGSAGSTGGNKGVADDHFAEKSGPLSGDTERSKLVADAYNNLRDIHNSIPNLSERNRIRAAAMLLSESHAKMKNGDDGSRELIKADGMLRLIARNMNGARGGRLAAAAYEATGKAVNLRETPEPVQPEPVQPEPETPAEAARTQSPGGDTGVKSNKSGESAEQRAKRAGRLRELRRNRQSERNPEARAHPGEYADVPTSKIHFDPDRFQYKIGAAPGTGSVGSLAGVKTYDPDFAGAIFVWRDPNDNKTYVVNGHNRLDLAKRLGVDKVHVKYLKANTPEEARAKGAATNIAEGRGTSLDAAKFFRDTGIKKEDVSSMGIPLREKVASEGLGLAGLESGMFRKVIDGEIPVARAAIIGGSGLSHAQQKDLYNQLNKLGRRGNVSDRTLKELVDNARSAGSRTTQGFDLFGSHEEEQSLAIHRASVQSSIKSELLRDRRLFGMVSRSRSAEELAERGRSSIDTETTGRLSKEAAGLLGVFDTLKNRSGPVATALNRAAERIADGENQRTVIRDTRAEITTAIEGFFGEGQPKAKAS